MNNKSWFPAWLPYPKSWMMAIRLAIPAYIGATVLFAFEFWRYLLVGGLGILSITNKSHLIFFFGVSAIALLLSLIWFLILTKVYALLLNVLWSNPPQWLILPKLRYLLIRDFGILVLSTFPIVLIFAIYILFFTGFKQTFTNLRTLRLTYDLFLLRLWWLWLIFAAYLYQWCITKSSVHNKF
ncbi:hypothetical protein H6G94_34465 [Nostoc punctiforme FACHB-252]|uniref:Uncharacterized protein n=1 Tax=Nostoc punctiforme FACHB-252 TaxID=1357509 RepID=A0ABR8HMK5_NOSPU|nr:hypothetical protein [Nostoc punctiforme]MBD2616285.1 hypothetical protein [Nostoc punctiforme FACHB-252]